ncbi:hypothetical protein L5515_019536 [Caenorhabditis briggsae]|uniref:Uncharacterized protein n=1 Tax=Caenorhabditis briggsae TaxID=6238 RepID=A0AAE9JU74_CAEBR|nr:hypothetical protein L5515_019536 [Caenorhabditis briggsae]
MTSQSSFPSPSDVQRRCDPRRATLGFIQVATIRLDAFHHVADHDFTTIIFTHRCTMSTIGRFLGGARHLHFLCGYPEALFISSEGQRYFHIKIGTTYYLMKVASEENGGQLKTFTEMRMKIEELQ